MSNGYGRWLVGCTTCITSLLSQRRVARVAFIISHLSGRALQWAQSFWDSNASAIASLETFLNHFQQVFNQSASLLSVQDQLFSIRQAKQTVLAYALRFRTLAPTSSWNEEALLPCRFQFLFCCKERLRITTLYRLPSPQLNKVQPPTPSGTSSPGATQISLGVLQTGNTQCVQFDP